MGARILIIEDNEANLALMTYLLQAFGHTVCTAIDGETGIAAARRNSPDLIICDVHLPKIDGYEVARRLKRHNFLRTVPLVAVTALAMVGDRDNVLAAGFDGYLSKPIVPESFVQEVEAFLSIPHSGAMTVPCPLEQNLQRPARQDNGKAVLVVDDQQINLNLMRSILEPFGYTVLTVSTSAEALVLARKKSLTLILCDWHMPKESGYEVIKRIKADPRLASIPVMMMCSSKLFDSERALIYESGAVKVIERPIKPELLIDEIAAFIGP